MRRHKRFPSCHLWCLLFTSCHFLSVRIMVMHRSPLVAALTIIVLLQAQIVSAYVHPVWGPSRAGTPVSVPATPYSQLYWPRIEQNAQESQQKQRVCKGVLNRYGSDMCVLERMNARIRGRFGFVCSPDDASAGRSRDQGSALTDPAELRIARDALDRKSTRLNSSHMSI